MGVAVATPDIFQIRQVMRGGWGLVQRGRLRSEGTGGDAGWEWGWGEWGGENIVA